MADPEVFEKLLAEGRDSALLRFSLGNAYLGVDPAKAVQHFERAVQYDPNYSAAWKLLGKARTAVGDRQGAIAAFESGVAAAAGNGDKQSEREMQVFLKRLRAAQR